MNRTYNSTEQFATSRNLGPVVFGTGLLVALLNVLSLPILKGSIIAGLPVIRSLDAQTHGQVALGIYFVSVGLAVSGSVVFAVLIRRARRDGRPEPSYFVFRPYVWTALINLVVIGIVYVAFKLS